MSDTPLPTCWKCGYDLRGLQVTDACPECGTPVWSTPPSLGATPGESVNRDAGQARTWGLGSLALFFLCLGPVALVAAIPAIHYGLRARAAVRTGRIPRESARGATSGLVYAGLTVALSVLYVVALAASGLF